MPDFQSGIRFFVISRGMNLDNRISPGLHFCCHVEWRNENGTERVLNDRGGRKDVSASPRPERSPITGGSNHV